MPGPFSSFFPKYVLEIAAAREDHETFGPVESVPAVKAIDAVGSPTAVFVEKHFSFLVVVRNHHVVGVFALALQMNAAAVGGDADRMGFDAQPEARHVEIVDAVIADVAVAVFAIPGPIVVKTIGVEFPLCGGPQTWGPRLRCRSGPNPLSRRRANTVGGLGLFALAAWSCQTVCLDTMPGTIDKTEEFLALEDRWGAHNYHPLDVVIERAEGPWVYSVEGRRYLDCLSAYSAVNQGHCHPKILAALRQQAARVTLTSRAFRNDQLPIFCKELATLCRLDAVVPMNTGAEAVETAIKAARRWGYRHKGIEADEAEIIVCKNNFHGRTTTIVGFSSDAGSREDFGPFTPGFVSIPFADVGALRAAITPKTCAFLVEPIQCEAGILIPPDGFLREAAEICRAGGVLLLLDEIQTGLGRTGRMFCADHEDVRPDAFILVKR